MFIVQPRTQRIDSGVKKEVIGNQNYYSHMQSSEINPFKRSLTFQVNCFDFDFEFRLMMNECGILK